MSCGAGELAAGQSAWRPSPAALPCCASVSFWPPACPAATHLGPLPHPHLHRRAKLEQELQAHQLSDEQRAAALADHERREREFSRLQRQRLCMEDFEPLRLIGKGAFGEVRICRDRSTGQLVAVKKLKKAEMVRRGQVGAGAAAGSSSRGGTMRSCSRAFWLHGQLAVCLELPARHTSALEGTHPLSQQSLPLHHFTHPQVDHVRAERNVLAEVRHHSIVGLRYSFQDEEYLYLVMEYLPGGDMMTLLIRKEILPEPWARFYLAQVRCWLGWVACMRMW